MKILYLVPATISKGPMGPRVLFLRQQLLQERASAGFEWEVSEIAEGPQSIESISDEEQCIPGMLQAGIVAERNGLSAIVLGCFADPGLKLARLKLGVPVLGPAECSLHSACTLGVRYGILTTSDDVVPLIRKVVSSTGLESRMAGIRTIGTTVSQATQDPELMIERLHRAGEAAVYLDGADVLVLGCMSLAFLELANRVEEGLRVPVVCPLTSVVEAAERVVRARSRRGTSVSSKFGNHPQTSVD